MTTAAWSLARRLPWTIQAERQSLARQLGVAVRLDDIKHLRPGAVLYENFVLADPETGQRLLRCRLLEVRQRTIITTRGSAKRVLVLHPSQPEIETSGLCLLGNILQRVMQEQIGPRDMDLRLKADALTICAGKNSQTVSNLDASLDKLSEGVQAAISFAMPGKNPAEPVRIRLVRNRQTIPPLTGFELHTGDGSLPCGLLAAALPEFGALGSQCRFRGYLWANQEANGIRQSNWCGQLSGEFLGADLDRLVSDNFPHKLGGLAHLTVQSARFNHGRLEEMTGTLVAGHGMVGRSLLQAAISHLRLLSDVDLASLDDQVPFDQFAMDVFLDNKGLRLQGRCSASQPSVIMAFRHTALLRAGQDQSLPATALIQTLVPQSIVQVPATDQTDWLVSHLPMPRIVAPTTREAVLPGAHLRLRKK
ncbi:MAG: hypothetical protein ACWGMZ_00220 [Thermoguttaceae bacterium]